MDENKKCPKCGDEIVTIESEVWTGQYKNVLEIQTVVACPTCEAAYESNAPKQKG